MDFSLNLSPESEESPNIKRVFKRLRQEQDCRAELEIPRRSVVCSTQYDASGRLIVGGAPLQGENVSNAGVGSNQVVEGICHGTLFIADSPARVRVRRPIRRSSEKRPRLALLYTILTTTDKQFWVAGIARDPVLLMEIPLTAPGEFEISGALSGSHNSTYTKEGGEDFFDALLSNHTVTSNIPYGFVNDNNYTGSGLTNDPPAGSTNQTNVSVGVEYSGAGASGGVRVSQIRLIGDSITESFQITENFSSSTGECVRTQRRHFADFNSSVFSNPYVDGTQVTLSGDTNFVYTSTPQDIDVESEAWISASKSNVYVTVKWFQWGECDGNNSYRVYQNLSRFVLTKAGEILLSDSFTKNDAPDTFFENNWRRFYMDSKRFQAEIDLLTDAERSDPTFLYSACQAVNGNQPYVGLLDGNLYTVDPAGLIDGLTLPDKLKLAVGEQFDIPVDSQGMVSGAATCQVDPEIVPLEVRSRTLGNFEELLGAAVFQ